MDVRKLVVLSLLAAVAFVLMATVQLPVLPQYPRYDPSDAHGRSAGMLLPVIIPFNTVKAAANALPALFVLAPALRQQLNPGRVPELLRR